MWAGIAQAELTLEVKAGDTPARVLIRNSKAVRATVGHALDFTTRKRYAYRLLLRSPEVAGALVHAGDRIVVSDNGKLFLVRAGAPRLSTAPTPPPPPEPVAIAAPPRP